MSDKEKLLILVQAILELEYSSSVKLLGADTVSKLEDLESDLYCEISEEDKKKSDGEEEA